MSCSLIASVINTAAKEMVPHCILVYQHHVLKLAGFFLTMYYAYSYTGQYLDTEAVQFFSISLDLDE